MTSVAEIMLVKERTSAAKNTRDVGWY